MMSRPWPLPFLIGALLPAAACADKPEDKPLDLKLDPTYFGMLEASLDRAAKVGPAEFSKALNSAYGICLSDYQAPGGCSKSDRAVTGFEVRFSRCTKIHDGPGIWDDYEHCEDLVRRRSDGKEMACARIVGWTQAIHHRYQSAEVRMHFDEDGSWRSGYSEEEKAEIELKNRKIEEGVKAGGSPKIAIAVPPLYSNLHCTADPKEFFQV